MRCNQTNKKFKVDITLSKDDGTPLSQEDMNEGSQLLMEYKKKSWSVTVTSSNTESSSPADKKNYCDRVDQSMKLGMQVQFGIYNSIRRGAKKNCLIKTKFLKCEILINS